MPARIIDPPEMGYAETLPATRQPSQSCADGTTMTGVCE
jgi:hypothetical protein